MAELKPFRGGYYLWKYLPSAVAAGIFAALFIVITTAHCWRICRTRKWFCIPLVVGGLMEFIGYVTRIAARSKTDHLMPYAIQSSLILLAPIFFAATIYMTLSRVVLSVPSGATLSPIRPSRLTKTFVTGDILTLCIQTGASGLMFQSSTRGIGNGVVLAGLGLQVCLFTAFLLVAVVFQRRVVVARQHRTGRLRRSLYMLYGVSALVLVRSVFRFVEYAGGQDGYLLSTEWPLFVFDTVPMWSVMVVFFIYFPDGLHSFNADGITDGVADGVADRGMDGGINGGEKGDANVFKSIPVVKA